MRVRIVLLLIMLTGLWGVVLARAAFLQLLPNERLHRLQKKQFETVVTLNPRRGDVVDRERHELAVSMTTYSLFADPKLIDDPRRVARAIGREIGAATGTSSRAVLEKLLQARHKRFVWLGRQLSKSVRDEIESLSIRGLGFIEESSRIYPNDRLLGSVLGFVGEEGQGLEGLELRYNDQLQALQKKVSYHRDARGRPLIVNGQIFNQVPDGSDVELTIDRELQFIVENEIVQAVREHEADSAVAVVLDAQTSEILAMASVPNFDPNHPQDFSLERKRNRAVTDSFEPGSVMKPILVAGALARGLVEPNTKFDCEGGIMHLGKRTIREAESSEKFGQLTVSEILSFSSNVGASKIGFKMGDKAVRENLSLFGFGEKTGVDLPGEARGIIQAMPWRDHLLANISFGQGMTATPLQIANAYAAIANGGWLKQPYIVKAIRDHESGEVAEMQGKSLRRVLTADQAAKLRMMLTGVTGPGGTGMRARVPGFPVAGKTGTAQKVAAGSRGYMRGGYVASFAGFLPANDPRYVIYVAVDHPRKGGYTGGLAAAPAFANIAKFAVRRSGLAPVLITEENVVPTARRVEARPAPPAQLPIQEVPALDVVHASVPDASPLAHGEVATVSGIVPDLSGLSLREVLNRISGSGVELRVHGHGYVSRSQPTAGAKIDGQKELNVYLE